MRARGTTSRSRSSAIPISPCGPSAATLRWSTIDYRQMNNDKYGMNVRLLMLLVAVLVASCSSSSQQGLGVYPKAVGAADEGFAIQALRTIATAQTQLKVTR